MQIIMKDNDYSLFEKLVGMTQSELHKTMRVYLKSKYKKVIATKDYIVAIGDIPVALLAHMDTVFKTPVQDLYYDRRKGILWSPDGLGADDRAGVFSIIQIIKSGLRPSIILTTDEEIGGLGSFALSQTQCPIPGLKFMVQLDRCGSNDCVFYTCANQKFIDYISNFGFIEKIGSFTDISYLMPAWNLCGVNLSVGYENEHDFIETLHVGSLYDTIKKVKKLLQSANFPDFEYIEEKTPNWLKWYGKYTQDDETTTFATCSKCGRYYPDYELFPVKGLDGYMKDYCIDCIAEPGVEWCELCGNPYEIDLNEKEQEVKLCKNCAQEALD